MVAQRVSSSLHVVRVTALVRQGGAYVPAYTLEDGAATSLSAESTIAARLSETRQPLHVALGDPSSWIEREASAADHAALAGLRAELLLPLAVKDRLLSILSLGPKRSEKPYSP